MAKRDVGISQVHEFMVVGPDASGLPGELAENPVIAAPGENPQRTEIQAPEIDPYAGPRSWSAKWFGPFFSATLPANRSSGLYLVYVGNYPLFVSSSTNVLIALNRHLMFFGHQVVPIDLLGREILHYTNIYRQPLSIKTGLLFEDGKIIRPKDFIYCYKRAAAALAFCHAIPCNKYARLSYEFETLDLANLGKSFPLKDKIHVEPSGKPANAQSTAADSGPV